MTPSRSPFRAALRVIEARAPGSRVAVATYATLVLSVGLAAVAVLLGLLVAIDRAAGGAFAELDRAVLAALVDRRSARGLDAAMFVTAVGNTLTLAVLVAWCAAVFLAAGRAVGAWLLVVAFAGGRLVTELMKVVFARPRPEVLEWGVHVTSPAFPSGHAMMAAVVFGALAYLVARPPTPAALRAAAWAFAGLLVAAIAASRVYLGVHYPSDVMAGACAGAVWVAVVLAAAGALSRPRGR